MILTILLSIHPDKSTSPTVSHSIILILLLFEIEPDSKAVFNPLVSAIVAFITSPLLKIISILSPILPYSFETVTKYLLFNVAIPLSDFLPTSFHCLAISICLLLF